MSNKFTLTELSLDEVSLVGDPANPGAQVVLWKSKTGPKGDDQMTVEELNKQIESQAKVIAKMTKESETDAASAAELTKQIEEQAAVIAKMTEVIKAEGADVTVDGTNVKVTKAKEKEYIDIEGERVEKSTVPAAFLKAMEAQNARILKMEEERVLESITKRATETLSSFPGNTSSHVNMLKAVDMIKDEEIRKSVNESLVTANKALSKLFKESGTTETDVDSSAVKLNKMATEFALEHKVTFHQAYDAVTKTAEGRSLANDVRKTAN